VCVGNNGLSHARLGLALSGKVIRRAVDRNALKRLIRESFRKNQGLLCGLDIVVTAYRNPRPYTNKTLTAALQKHWETLAKCKTSFSG
jgi:ribonuclease P protein component